MKKILLVVITIALFKIAPAQYDAVVDNQGKFYKGIITDQLLQSDTSMKWWASNKTPYTPNAAAVAALKSDADSVHFMVFMGTWCGDSHYIIPKFYSLLDASGISSEKVSLIATDRSKKAPGNLSETFSVKNVPTIIVMKNGKEAGRVVEYGTSGLFDKDLSVILQALK